MTITTMLVIHTCTVCAVNPPLQDCSKLNIKPQDTPEQLAFRRDWLN